MALGSRMTFKAVASPTIVILMTLEVSFTLIENIYTTGVNHDDDNIFKAQTTGLFCKHVTIVIYYCNDSSLCYKTSDFCFKLVFVLGKPFHPSLMFVGDARSLP